jgi:type I restriction enzyme S subunit
LPHDDRSLLSIRDLCESGVAELQTGPFGSQLHAHEYTDRGVPVVPTEAIGDRRIDHEKLPKIALATAERLRKHRLFAGDILFARRGAQATGRSAIVKANEEGWICGTGAIRLRLARDNRKIHAEFLSHILAARSSVDWFKHHAIGATMPNLNEGIIRQFSFLAPPYEDQRAIAFLLSAVDDKIELNRRMNETLEAIARAIFKSWFVDFNPVRAKAEGRKPYGMDEATADLFPSCLTNSGLGEIPDGWEVAPLPKLIDVNPTRSLRKGDIAPYLDMANMPTRGHAPDEVIDRPFGSGMRFINGDTLVARITPCLENGKTAFVDFLHDGQVGWGSTEYIVLRPKPPLPEEFAYCLARSEGFRDFAIQSMTGSSGRQRVPAESLAHFQLAIPPKPLAESFSCLVKPLFARGSRRVRVSHPCRVAGCAPSQAHLRRTAGEDAERSLNPSYA